MATFTIPTIFTAVDKFSGPVKAMGNSVHAFASKAESALARSERAFRRLTPSIGSVGRDLINMAGAVSVAAVGAFATNSIMDYETELANLRAVTGASGKDFDVFKSKIQQVAVITKKSSVEVAQAFTAIANNQPELLKDAEALAMVTQSSIMLAQAARLELQPAGEALTVILNQFGKGAKDAAKTIDILAAGSVAGSSEIRDTADAIQQFGVVAANAGIKINESVALIELGSKFQKGIEAGVKFRNILLTMSAIKVQDPKALADLRRLGVNLDIVQNSALPLADRLKELSKIGKDNAAIFHVFGKENQAMATGILNTADNFQTMLDAVNTSGMAAKMAADNNNTLAIRLQQVKAAFINMLTSSDSASSGLTTAKNVVGFVAENMDTLLSIITKVIIAFALWKAAMITTSIALGAYNIVIGISGALTGMANVAIGKSTIAMNAYKIATWAVTAAQWLWNAAMSANPIGLIIIGIAALIALVAAVIVKWNEWGAAIAVLLGPLGFVISLIQAFRRNWEMIKKSFTDGGFLSGIKAIGATILDAILMPLQAVLKLVAKVTGAKWAQSAVDSLQGFRESLGVNLTTDEGGKPLVNPEAVKQTAMQNVVREQTNNARVQLDINDPTGRVTPKSNDPLVNVNLSSTLGWAHR